jgi:hypothetical protein
MPAPAQSYASSAAPSEGAARAGSAPSRPVGCMRGLGGARRFGVPGVSLGNMNHGVRPLEAVAFCMWLLYRKPSKINA